MNGMITPNSRQVGTIAILSCNDNYSLVPANATVRVCQNDLTWSGPEGACRGTCCCVCCVGGGVCVGVCVCVVCVCVWCVCVTYILVPSSLELRLRFCMLCNPAQNFVRKSVLRMEL